GYSWISIDQKRKAKNDAGDDYLGYDISSSPDTERYFIALNANGYYKMDKWNFTGTLGYIYAEEEQDAFAESDGTRVSASTVELGQIYLKAEASYSFDSVEPYLNLGYEYDTTYDDENSSTFGKFIEYKDGASREREEENIDKDGFTAALGLRYLLLKTLQGDLQAAGIFGRDNYDEYTISLNLRYDF
ncbi:MAG: autotransporter outer membrane beta-barrel domain-containing protein, partial [Desulfococcaceae bacterium]|nr:autotransporter outer membrane beta-barrel domain-containing protein [Desulfococcaceae bacterium]